MWCQLTAIQENAAAALTLTGWEPTMQTGSRLVARHRMEYLYLDALPGEHGPTRSQRPGTQVPRWHLAAQKWRVVGPPLCPLLMYKYGDCNT
ncbi:uncharacterized protein TRIREDRAFT_109044 [Trichoderma reesei QM6a]|uniref:Predicted protein n=1 Tax=Hypocrea jecorina (strain QM6a) TaxID=431241 RepID=G0RNP6_HYPJQ|nr:uncharacterized protein TRIREDRAFT_109044 [Trichoderma reesei QM6a]EGR47189.1 predicted protein [Trichoderma reesei QM6a]